jgi:O-antigen ligase
MRFPSTRGRRRLVVLVVLLAVAAAVTRAVQGVMADAQLQLLIARLSDPSSFNERLAVWRNVAAFMLRSPHTLWVGLGPDVSVRAGQRPIFSELFMGDGFRQGAVDSGYLYVALNFGLIVLAVVAAMTLSSLARLTPSARRGDGATERSAWIVLAVWTVMAATQQHGIAKPVMLFVQCLALADLCLVGRLAGARARGAREPGEPSFTARQ